MPCRGAILACGPLAPTKQPACGLSHPIPSHPQGRRFGGDGPPGRVLARTRRCGGGS
jgi:hypothetical protein